MRTMSRPSPKDRQPRGRLFLAACYLILLVIALISGELILAAVGAIGLAWAFETLREYRREKSE